MNRSTLRSPAKSRKGFTLVELMIVIVIVGMLAAAAIVGYGSSKASAAEATMKTDVSNSVVSLEAFAARNGGSYTGATVANTGATNTQGNVLSFVTVTANGATIRASNATANRRCSRTIGNAPVGLLCEDGVY